MPAGGNSLEMGGPGRSLEVVKGNDPRDFLSSGFFEHGTKCDDRTQLDVDISRPRQEFEEKPTAPRRRKVVCPTLGGMPRGNNERGRQSWDGRFELGQIARE